MYNFIMWWCLTFKGGRFRPANEEAYVSDDGREMISPV